ncbi:MAG: type secretion system secreted protein Hcp [Gaiellaceae bacterium]|jgi:type VI secretion system secreted protein Hcp|nr:type secretion system secreted protein Hcp [Gaiellaceae bacterium]
MRSKLLVGMTIVVLAVAGLATYSWAASPDGQTINACLNDDGKLRLVTAGTACKKAESPLSWNTVGPAGAQGPAGPAGAQGPPGAAVSDPNAVSGTVAITGKKQGAFGPITLSGISHEIVSPRDAASGLPTGKRQHKPITITKEWGPSTPLLLNALTTNESLTSVLIGLLRDGKPIATVKLTNASVSNYVSHGLTESWSFTYQKIEWTWVDGGITAQDDWEAPVA